MDKYIKITFYVIVAIVLVWVILWQSNRRTDALMTIGECVEKKVMEDAYAGTLDEAWTIYAQGCAKNK